MTKTAFYKRVYNVIRKHFIVIILINSYQHTYSQQSINSTIDSLEQLISTYEKKDTIYVNIHNNLSSKLWYKNPKRSEDLAYIALQVAKNIHFNMGEGDAHKQIAISHWARGNHKDAIDHLLKALTIFNKLSNQNSIADTYEVMALVYDNMGDQKKSLKFHFKALSYYEEDVSLEVIATAYNNIGAVHHKMKSYDSASYYYDKSLSTRIQTKNKFKIAESYNNLGVLNYDMGNSDIALNYYNISAKFKLEIENYNGLAPTYNNIARIHLIQNRYQLAEAYLDTALVYGRRIEANKWILGSLSLCKDLETARGDYKKALEYSDQYHYLRDSLFSIEKLEKITLLEEQFHAAERDIEIALLEKDNAIRLLWRNVLGVFLALVLILSIFIFYYQRQKIKRNKQFYKTKQVLSEKEIENLKLKEKDLQHEIYFKNKELASYTINFIQKNKLFDNLRVILNNLHETSDQKIKPTIRNMQRLVKRNAHIDKDWEQFKQHFTNVHPYFFQNLKKHHPDLSPVDLRLSALLKMNLTAKESSAIMGIGPDSVKTARYRLRKKFDLDREDSLTDYLINIDK